MPECNSLRWEQCTFTVIGRDYVKVILHKGRLKTLSNEMIAVYPWQSELEISCNLSSGCLTHFHQKMSLFVLVGGHLRPNMAFDCFKMNENCTNIFLIVLPLIRNKKKWSMNTEYVSAIFFPTENSATNFHATTAN